MEKIISNDIKSQLKRGDVLVREVITTDNRDHEGRKTTFIVTSVRNGCVYATAGAYSVTDIDFEYTPASIGIKSIEWFLDRSA